MKKMMIMLGAVVLAACANAAAVNWQSGAVYTTDSSAKVGKGATDYTVAISFFTDAAGTTAVAGLTGDLSLGTAGTGSKYSGTVDGFAANTTYYAQLLITTEGYEAKSKVVAFSTPANGDVILNFADGIGFDEAYTFSTSVAGTWKATGSTEPITPPTTDVPEPTSGLLLLVGAAALALKRKVA